MYIKIILLVGLGFLFLGLGLVGLLLPVLPTTPFILVSAACFSCTPRLRMRIMKIPFFREYMENYKCRKGLSRKTILISLGYLWGMLLLSALLTWTLWIAFLLFSVGTAVTLHILWMSKSKPFGDGNDKR